MMNWGHDPEHPGGARRPDLPQGRRLCWLFFVLALKFCQAKAPVQEEKQSVSSSNLPCWLVEGFVVAEECAPCSNFQAETTPECSSTGYLEKITCSSSKRNEFKSCRSAKMEQHLFWKFEGAVMGVALVFACLVILHQRPWDRKALEKARKQTESIYPHSTLFS
ncbi:PREDICTED: protein JTB-like [Chrysochloris asiatica]|uniref:Protein JTB n=1 Tax=Chrysochloris asiatica TaxID=185453 RepID=A0A9B0TGR3_CHRAS|nr:PREDICTED: protein JTB-like [Chrysochloris asiatica]